MKKSLALLLMNMLAAEFGYKLEWLTGPEDSKGSSFCLINMDKDAHTFSGENKFEDAVQWLRQKA